MGSTSIDRVFHKAFSAQSQAEQAAAQPRVKTKQDEEEELRHLASKMDASDAIQRMLLATRDKDFFRLLELPAPEADELGRPIWSCTPSDVSRAYRRLSVLVHPDKNPGDDARQAFEALTQAHKALRDPGQLEELLKEAADTARRRQEAAEAAATPQERVALFAAKKERARTLQHEQGSNFQAEIQKQIRERQQRAKRKREVKSSYRQDDEDPDEHAAATHGGRSKLHEAENRQDDMDDDNTSLAAQLARRGARRKAIF